MVNPAARNGGTARTLGQVISLIITASAALFAVTTVVLVFVAGLTVLWPVALACGCTILIGLIAFAIVRLGGRERNAKVPIYKEVSYAEFNVKNVAAMSKYARGILWARIKEIAELYEGSFGMSRKKINTFFSKKSPDPSIFARLLFSSDYGSILCKLAWDSKHSCLAANTFKLFPDDLLMKAIFGYKESYSIYRDPVFTIFFKNCFPEYAQYADCRNVALQLFYDRFSPEMLRKIFTENIFLKDTIANYVRANPQLMELWSALLDRARLN
ncbi:MAG: hypothetical protein LBT98_00105 [Puniceicoccales bacterium]|nr:hypothetical protein [Puniceicoccales bacterium]